MTEQPRNEEKTEDNSPAGENLSPAEVVQPLSRDTGSAGAPDLVGSVFGELAPDAPPVAPSLRTEFAPWHHPVKQVVRDYQWARQCSRLLQQFRKPEEREVLRYFTLPGADLLDVRVLAKELAKFGTKIEYFGFDSGYGDQSNDRYLITESGLRQAGRITDNAEVLRDRLEDIARPGSQAANRLKGQAAFDVVNIDACDHLGYIPTGRRHSVFDALECLLAHQLTAQKTWLLFITTRAQPDLLGVPAMKLQGAIHNNLSLYTTEFGEALAKIIDGNVTTIGADFSANWSKHSPKFLKLFCVGLGKYLLQYYYSQHNLQADVELVSAFAYKVHECEPDMLSLAFRIEPLGLKVLPASTSPASVVPPLELKKAIGIAEKAASLWDLDQAIADDRDVRNKAVTGTKELLGEADYDLSAWEIWLAKLPIRPMNITP